MRIAVIPAKGTSTRIPGKNIREFCGRPIIAYSIETARASGLFDRIFVSTRDTEVIKVARALKTPIIMRPFELSEINHADCGTQEVTRHAIYAFQKSTGKTVDYACCIYPCAPLMIAEDLRRGWQGVTAQEIDFAYGVGIDPFRDAGAWYWGSAPAFLDRRPLDQRGVRVMKVVIPEERVCDINTEADWLRAELLYKALQRKEETA